MAADKSADPDVDNTSNTRGPIPPEVQSMGFCWGAFEFTFYWGLWNSLPVALIALAIGLASMAAGLFLFPLLAPVAIFSAHLIILPLVLALRVWLGLIGHPHAWQHRRFRDVGHFRETMRVWNNWGIVIAILYFMVVVPLSIRTDYREFRQGYPRMHRMHDAMFSPHPGSHHEQP